ncbi:hypothetical protein ACFE04_017737 [Oxalis oulophora]
MENLFHTLATLQPTQQSIMRQQFLKEVSVPPPTQPTPTPATSNLDPAVIIRNYLRAWTVYILNPSGGFDLANMTLKLLIDLKKGRRVVVDFEGLSPFGNVAGLLGAACCLIATDYNYFPISFKSWGDVPHSYFDNAWNNMFEEQVFMKLENQVGRQRLFLRHLKTVGVEDWTVKLEEDDDSSDGSNGA